MKDHCSAGSCPYRKDDTLCTSKIRLFRSLPVEAQEQLIAHSIPSAHPKGTILLQEGQQIDSILIIRKGRLKTCRLEANGEEHVLDILHDGQAIWHDMFLKDPVYHYSVVCLTDVSICEIRREEFLELLKQQPETAMSLIQMLSTELSEAKEKILLLSIRDPEVRLAGFLLDRDTRCIGPAAGNGIEKHYETGKERSDQTNRPGKDPGHRPAYASASVSEFIRRIMLQI